MFYLISDTDINTWFVDMDPHSLVPPCDEADAAAIALLPEFQNIPPSSVDGGGQSPVSVQGRLKRSVNFWECELEASEFVLGIIWSGYRLPFIRFPPPVCMTSPCSGKLSICV